MATLFHVAAATLLGGVLVSTAAAQVMVTPPCTCTREFRELVMEVRDQRGRTPSAWTATVRRQRDGKILRRIASDGEGASVAEPAPVQGRTPVIPETPGAPGGLLATARRLVVADDGMLPDIARARESLVVDVRAGRLRGRATVVVGWTGTKACRCHVALASGPSRIVVR